MGSHSFTGRSICSCTWVALTWIWVFYHLAQPLLPNSHQPKLNKADSGTTQIKIYYTTQVRHQMEIDLPVLSRDTRISVGSCFAGQSTQLIVMKMHLLANKLAFFAKLSKRHSHKSGRESETQSQRSNMFTANVVTTATDRPIYAARKKRP